MRDLAIDSEYRKVLTRDLVAGDVVYYPVGTTSQVLTVTKIGWRKYRMNIRPDGGKIMTFDSPGRTVWWVKTGGV